MKALVKLRNNVLSLNALRVLGTGRWLYYLGMFVRMLPAIIRSRDLRPLDQVMGQVAKEFRVRDTRFVLDCAYCDEKVRDGFFAFGLAREIYIRDCYFRFHGPYVWNSMRTVVDLGANRGAFSVMAASRCRFVLCVEAQPHFAPVIRHNMEVNSFTNYAIETALVGEGGALADYEARRLTMDELFNRHRLAQVDLIKLDIEGSEFELFEHPEWLDRVRAVSMEIHPLHGHPEHVVDVLTRKGFSTVLATENLQRTSELCMATFVYASRLKRC
jgi:hypothetical protein